MKLKRNKRHLKEDFKADKDYDMKTRRRRR
jgi:hypothetical protein